MRLSTLLGIALAMAGCVADSQTFKVVSNPINPSAKKQIYSPTPIYDSKQTSPSIYSPSTKEQPSSSYTKPSSKKTQSSTSSYYGGHYKPYENDDEAKKYSYPHNPHYSSHNPQSHPETKPEVRPEEKGSSYSMNYIPPTYPEPAIPFHYVNFPDQMEHPDIEIPTMSNTHCFLGEAPWSECGRRSLAAYFIEQCTTFYYLLSSNVDGLCNGVPPTPTPEPESWYLPRKSESISEYVPNPTSAFTKSKPTAAPSRDGISSKYGIGSNYGIAAYQKERCLQSAYVSITTAVVSCLTENMIRLKFIEHYSKHARKNPIEGPILYLRKLHTFIRNVVQCSEQNNLKNYPNLWMTYQNEEGKVTYNPNTPFFLDDHDENAHVKLDYEMSKEAAGIKQFTVGNHFLCSNPQYLEKTPLQDSNTKGGAYYLKDSTNSHYDKVIIDTCTTSSKTYLGYDQKGNSRVLKRCQWANATKKQQYLSDRSLQSLYNSVHAIQRNQIMHRPQTIAEIAIRLAGVKGQPILEGFGFLYFCAFHACKANTHGDMEGHCFPESKSCEDEWHVPSSVTTWAKIQEFSRTIKTCLYQGTLSKFDIVADKMVQQFNENLHRSYTCLSEHEIVDFFNVIGVDISAKDDAFGLVYVRHLAVEKCYETKKGYCVSNKDLYQDLHKALFSLVQTCTDENRKPIPVGEPCDPRIPASYNCNNNHCNYINYDYNYNNYNYDNNRNYNYNRNKDAYNNNKS